MASVTKYTVHLTLSFSSEAYRDSVYTKIKTALTSAKVTEPWDTGTISKSESVQPLGGSETV